ncbi:3-hydroxybenzoate 6-hydroxylase 1 [Hordeum vulgare]|nr:3-hydroxybenzoate 6-hydroxylase 1 [Hordeum vulgare]
MKQFMLTKLRSIKAPPEVLEAVERSEMNMNDVLVAPLRYRPPLSLLFASISKGNVCVAGDALHPTTPDLAQGACVALEDAVVLARCLGDAIAGRERETVEAALRRYAGIRRWRSGQVIAASYVVGLVQQSDHAVVRFARDRLLSGMLAKGLLMMPDYDCGTVRCELSGLERELGLLSVLSLVIRCQTVNLSMYSFGRHHSGRAHEHNSSRRAMTVERHTVAIG